MRWPWKKKQQLSAREIHEAELAEYERLAAIEMDQYSRASQDLADGKDTWRQWVFGGHGRFGALQRLRAQYNGAEVRKVRDYGAAFQVEVRSITGLPWMSGGTSPLNQQNSEDRALSLGAVFACVRFLADNISTLPIDLYRQGDNTSTKLPQPSLLRQPGMRGTRIEWVHRAVVSLALRGNAFGWIMAEDAYGNPTEIEWLHPDWVHVADQAIYGKNSYWNPTWRVHGIEVNPADILHIAWFPVPGRVLGLSPIEAYARTLNIGLAADSYADNWFATGGVPPGKFKNTMKTLKPEDAEIITDRLVGRIKSGKPLVYGADWEFEPISIRPAEARFVETHRLSATTIAAIYGIDPNLVGGDSGGHNITYANIESRFVQILTQTLRPWLEKIEMSLSNLFPRPQFVQFDVDGWLRTDAKTRAEIAQMALGGPGTAWRTIDEVRASENRPAEPSLKTAAEAALAQAKASKPDPTTAPAPKLAPAAAAAQPAKAPAAQSQNGHGRAKPVMPSYVGVGWGVTDDERRN